MAEAVNLPLIPETPDPYSLLQRAEAIETSLLAIPALLGVLCACLHFWTGWSLFGFVGAGAIAVSLLVVFTFALLSMQGPPRTRDGTGPARLLLFLRHEVPSVFAILREQRGTYLAVTEPEERAVVLSDVLGDMRSQSNLTARAMCLLARRYLALVLVVIVTYSSWAWMLSTSSGDKSFRKTFLPHASDSLLCEGIAFRTFVNHFYVTTVTAVTLGYGDFVPEEGIDTGGDECEPHMATRLWSVLAVLTFVCVIALSFPSAVGTAATVEKMWDAGEEAVVSFFEDPVADGEY